MLFIDAAMVAGLAAWLVVGVADNWRHPGLNLEVVASVLRLDLMEQEYPQQFALVAHRRIEDPGTVSLLFALIRWVETVSAALLLVATAALAGAGIGLVGTGTATALGIAATAVFILIWAAFLIGGNHFCYWYCHPWAQSNHFMLMVWGFLVLLVLLN